MRDLFGNTQAYYITHPEEDYAVRIYAAYDGEAFASMKASGIPSYDEGWCFYTNGNNPALRGKRIISLQEYKSRQEDTP